MLSLREHEDADDYSAARGRSGSRRVAAARAASAGGAHVFPLGLSFNFLNDSGIGTDAPQPPPAGRPMLASHTKREVDRSWDGFDVYCGTFRVRRTSILTLMMFVLALSCIGGAAVISLSFYYVADAIVETERVIDPALTAALPLVRHAGAVMEEARQASSSVGALLNHTVAAADAAVPAVQRAAYMLNATSLLVERMARLARHPTVHLQMDSD